MPAALLAKGQGEIIDQDEVVPLLEIGDRQGAKLVETRAAGMMHLGPDRIGLREQADLVQGHALFEEHSPRQDFFRRIAQEIALREGRIRLVSLAAGGGIRRAFMTITSEATPQKAGFS
jgi:hypothetical protein